MNLIAAACALRVASMTATFCIPATRLGLVYPAGGLRRLRRVMGNNVERVLLTAAPFSALQSQAWGLVHDVVGDARTHARSLAQAVALNAPLAVSGTRQALRVVDEDGDNDAIDAIRARSLESADLIEGLEAHRLKRTPKFEGR